MSKQDKPETPESEKLAAKHSSKMFSRGSAVKDLVGKAHLGDMRKSGASNRMAAASGAAAVKNKYKAIASRHKRGTGVARSAEVTRGIAGSMAMAGKGGQNTGAQARSVIQGANAVANTGGIISRIDHNKSMEKAERSNSKKQALLDATTGAVMAHSMGVFDGEKTKGKSNLKSSTGELRSVEQQASDYFDNNLDMGLYDFNDPRNVVPDDLPNYTSFGGIGR